MKITFKQLSSLEKIFLDSKEFPEDYTEASALRGERFSYQIAYTVEGSPQKKIEAELTVESELESYISIRKVG